jgi:hypothetical protein
MVPPAFSERECRPVVRPAYTMSPGPLNLTRPRRKLGHSLSHFMGTLVVAKG